MIMKWYGMSNMKVLWDNLGMSDIIITRLHERRAKQKKERIKINIINEFKDIEQVQLAAYE